MVAGEARHGRFGILGDVMYVELKADASTPGPLFGSGTLKVKDFTSTIEGAYRVVDSPSVKLDGLAGVRIFSIDNELSLSSGILAARSGTSGDTWADPVVGVRAMVPFGSGFFVNGYGDVGGFGISGDLTWQLYGGLGYNFNNWLTGYAGYRYLDIHHEDGGFVFDVAQQGPLLGVGLRF
jgi:opacity protein-like surface antigen